MMTDFVVAAQGIELHSLQMAKGFTIMMTLRGSAGA